MAVPSDGKLEPDKLSATSRKMAELKEEVLAEWETRTRLAFADANELRHPIFIDTIPAYYDNLVEALSPNCPRDRAVSSSNLASEHGGERARMTSYSPEELVLEYQIFRETLIDLLSRSITLSTEEIRIINSSIDGSIRESITAFYLVVSALREQFIAALTHDMRGPLGSASMAAEIISLTTDSPETIELAHRIRDNIKRVDRMVQGLLDTMVFQRGERLRLQLTYFDIRELATEISKEYVHIHKTRCDVLGESAWGWWGQDALKRALENLVGNALKYGHPNTPIRISVNENHGRLMLSVHNEGPPIPVEDQESIFQIFRRAQEVKDGRHEGWGIGLPYVRAVAESHGGSVAIDSSAETGTTFVIDIPVDCRPFQDAPTVS
jgi:signal transduction histidine kinase